MVRYDSAHNIILAVPSNAPLVWRSTHRVTTMRWVTGHSPQVPGDVMAAAIQAVRAAPDDADGATLAADINRRLGVAAAGPGPIVVQRIAPKSETPREIACRHCGSVLRFSSADVVPKNYASGIDPESDYRDSILCPVCTHWTTVDAPRAAERTSRE